MKSYSQYITLLLIAAIPLLIMADSPKKRIVPFGSPLNSAQSDFAPSFTGDGSIMVFNSRRGGRDQDIYISFFRDGTWGNPINLRVLNSPHHDETPFITADGKFIFFASDRDGSIAMPKDEQGRILISYDIYFSENINGHWSAPERLPGAVNTVNHERAPSLCLRTETLYYTSWPFGNVKNSRIMKADLVKGDFINVQELPPPVNTYNQDMAFVPNRDCSGFYFSSRRSGGYGGWDIYYVSLGNGVFGTPTNMGPEINSPQNEFFYTAFGKSIYLCSNRPGGPGDYDIVTLQEDRRILFQVRNKKTGEPLTATALLSHKKTVPPYDRPGKAAVEKKSDRSGKFSVDVHPLLKEFDIEINKEGFLPLFKSINPERAGSTEMLELTPIEKDASFEIHAIHFDYNSSNIRPESYRYLDQLARYLKKYKRFRFRIIGHTDLHGPEEYNRKLSLKRARAVKKYLVKKGLDPNRFEVEGAGESRPLVRKEGPGYDEQNRRTEFKLIGKE